MEELQIPKYKAETIANALRLTANIYNCRNKKGKQISDERGGFIGAETAWDREVVLAEKYIKEILEQS